MYSSTLSLTSALVGGWVVNGTPRDPVPKTMEAGWAQGPVWKGGENLAPIRIRSPDRPVGSKLLYRLSYPGRGEKNENTTIIVLGKEVCSPETLTTT
jgi:hypothetical protein